MGRISRNLKRMKRRTLLRVSGALAELEADAGSVEDLGAVNRWPERSALPLEDYLRQWRASCAQIQSPGRLPVRLQEMLALN
jgi:hypothetical protein